jgi:hypothetical protein
MSVKLGKYGMTSTKLAKFEYIQIGERKMVSFISVYIMTLAKQNHLSINRLINYFTVFDICLPGFYHIEQARLTTSIGYWYLSTGRNLQCDRCGFSTSFEKSYYKKIQIVTPLYFHYSKKI